MPHFDGGSVTQSVMFRLADSLPRTMLDAWEEELRSLPETRRNIERRKRIEEYLDRGEGEAWLRDPRIAGMVEDALLFFDGKRYAMHAWVVMPNHVHAIFTPAEGWRMKTILHAWKSFTAKSADKIPGQSGTFWQKESFDRFIRNEEHYWTAVN